jgi:serine/threonine protein kinase
MHSSHLTHFIEGGEVYKLGDFGLIAPLDEQELRDGDGRYVAPELLQMVVRDRRHLQKADIFSLGCTVYELATDASPKGLPSTYVIPVIFVLSTSIC